VLNSKTLFGLKSALLAGAAMVAYSGVAVQAQEAGKVEKVTVTGTRIKQRDYTSVSPLATVGAKEISLTGTVNIEELTNTLPQILPSVTITSNNPSNNGFGFADLRGLGANRTLILINGRRANPSSTGALVDLNTIPATLIDRIEVITGGASAVYGADAVAGAINFILKSNFEGMTGGISYQQAEDGVAPQAVADAIIGGVFDGGRGALQLAVQYQTRDAELASVRAFSNYDAPVLGRAGEKFVSFNVTDLQIAGTTALFGGGSPTAPWGSLGGFSVANVQTISGLTLDNDCNPANGVQATTLIRFRVGGGIQPFQNCAFPNITNGDGTTAADSDSYNFSPDNFLILGNERLNAFASARYDILPNDEMTAFAEAQFTNSKSLQQLAATPATGLVVKYDLDPGPLVYVNPYVRAQTQLYNLALLQFGGVAGPDGDGVSNVGLNNRTFGLSIRTNQVGLRTGEIETNAVGFSYGLRGVFPSLEWDWEIYHGYARNMTTVKNNNNIGRTAFTQLLNACNTTTTLAQTAPIGALPNCVFPHNSAAGGAFVPTATANNPLGFLSLSNAMREFVRINSTDVITYERNLLSANATGDVIDLWGEGAISAAIGFEYREEELDSRVDPFKAAGDIIGFNAQESIQGSYDVYELYGEVAVPLLTEEFLAEKLQLVGGYRKSDYDTGAGITETWKYGAEWAPFTWLTARWIENHAVRAPNAQELFRAGDQNFPAYVDPCDKDVVLAGDIPECTAWFADYGLVYNPLTHDAAAGQVQAFLFGNPNLTPEIADTVTYGFVFNPGEWWPVGELVVSVDRYEIEITNQIGQRGIATILNGCIAQGGALPASDCALAPRDPLSLIPGQVAFVNQSLANFAVATITEGLDVNFRWGWDLEEDTGLPGRLGVASLYTFVDTFNDGVERAGQTFGFLGGRFSEHKAATNFTYDLEDLSFLVRWSYLSPVEDVSVSTAFRHRLPAYNLYDVGANWNFDDHWAFSAGVENLFDEQPPLHPAGALIQYNTDTSVYDQLGRQFRLGVRWRN